MSILNAAGKSSKVVGRAAAVLLPLAILQHNNHSTWYSRVRLPNLSTFTQLLKSTFAASLL